MNAGGGLPWKTIVILAAVVVVAILLAANLFAGRTALPGGEDAGVDSPGEHGDFGNMTVGPDGNPVGSAAPATSGSGQ